ncbi:hypothetical protein [Micromonospora sp. LOL_023]|uniref:hypothetical protein n=1 Tax=Micromonospora sp. LOL_023 TaxID=3345418 RepID=UPI003A8AFA9F
MPGNDGIGGFPRQLRWLPAEAGTSSGRRAGPAGPAHPADTTDGYTWWRRRPGAADVTR